MQLDDAFLQNDDGSLSIQDSVKTALIYIDNCRKDVLVRIYSCFIVDLKFDSFSY